MGYKARWNHDDHTVTLETFDTVMGDNNIARQLPVGQLTASVDEWLNMIVTVLSMMRGKPNADLSEFLLAPSDADPGMIGQLIADRLREHDSRM